MIRRSGLGCLPDQHSPAQPHPWSPARQGESYSSVFSLVFHGISSWWKKKRGITGAVSDSCVGANTKEPHTNPHHRATLRHSPAAPGNGPAPQGTVKEQ